MMKSDRVLTSDRSPLGSDVDDLAKRALLQIGKEVFAGKEWPL